MDKKPHDKGADSGSGAGSAGNGSDSKPGAPRQDSAGKPRLRVAKPLAVAKPLPTPTPRKGTADTPVPRETKSPAKASEPMPIFLGKTEAVIPDALGGASLNVSKDGAAKEAPLSREARRATAVKRTGGKRRNVLVGRVVLALLVVVGIAAAIVVSQPNTKTGPSQSSPPVATSLEPGRQAASTSPLIVSSPSQNAASVPGAVKAPEAGGAPSQVSAASAPVPQGKPATPATAPTAAAVTSKGPATKVPDAEEIGEPGSAVLRTDGEVSNSEVVKGEVVKGDSTQIDGAAGDPAAGANANKDGNANPGNVNPDNANAADPNGADAGANKPASGKGPPGDQVASLDNGNRPENLNGGENGGPAQGKSGNRDVGRGGTPSDSLDGRADRREEDYRMGDDATRYAQDKVVDGLNWLARHQLADGGWSFDHTKGECNGRCGDPGSLEDTRVAATGLALLPFLGGGYNPVEGKYRHNVAAGLIFLMRAQNKGSFVEKGGRMYGHGIATLALCEAWGMVAKKPDRGAGNDPYDTARQSGMKITPEMKREIAREKQMDIAFRIDRNRLHDAAQGAVAVILGAQNDEGGWRYYPGQKGDMSVVGWQIMALASAQQAGFIFDKSVGVKATNFLQLCGEDPQGDSGYGKVFTKFVYMPAAQEKNGKTRMTPATTAIGLLTMIYMGVSPEHPGMEVAVQRLAQQGPDASNMYATYYANQVMYQHGGDAWKLWKKRMEEMLLPQQQKQGHLEGSWFLPGDHGAKAGGRVYSTVMALLCLEENYRHMRIFDNAKGNAQAAKNPKKGPALVPGLQGIGAGKGGPVANPGGNDVAIPDKPGKPEKQPQQVAPKPQAPVVENGPLDPERDNLEPQKEAPKDFQTPDDADAKEKPDAKENEPKKEEPKDEAKEEK